MKRTSAALLAHLALRSGQTVARCARVQRKDATVVRFTDLDTDIVISGWAAPDAALNGTYLCATGFLQNDISHTSALNVDNTEVVSPQVSPAILEADLHAGLWDRAKVTQFLVNYADLTMGPHYLMTGRVGEMSTGTGTVRSEIRGLMQAYTQTLVPLTSPTCRNDFCDAKCTLNAATFTVTGTLTGVSLDGLTLRDTGRTEPGPSTGVAITGISNAKPGVVTMANASLNLQTGQAVTLSGVVGMPLLNVVTLALNPSGSTFELSIDTTDTAAYGTWSSGGTVTPVGGGRSAFDGGKFTATSGPSAGFSEDVVSYVPGQWKLARPMPYGLVAGNTYSLVQGCGKNMLTNCVGEYSNGINFNGEPYVGGRDLMVQVGRHV